jgi:hypothetical protein
MSASRQSDTDGRTLSIVRQFLFERVTTRVRLAQAVYPSGQVLVAIPRREREARRRKHRGMTLVPTS